MARRDNSDPTGIGQTLNWAWAWPANRRIMYNRASCDLSGQPFDPRRGLIRWNGKSWEGADRSEEHTSALQSLMRNSYAVFCLKKTKKHTSAPTSLNTNTNAVLILKKNKKDY